MSVLLADLKKRYVGPDGSVVPVIDIPRFQLATGEQVALVGSSGSGKTTLLHLIAGILTPDSGRIIFDENEPNREGMANDQGTHAQSINKGQSSIPKPRTLNPEPYIQKGENEPTDGPGVDITRLSEADRDVFRGRNIGYIFQTHHLLSGFTALENVLLGMSFTGRASDPAWAMHLLQEVGLGDRLNYKPAKLSVGQQQRVAVARALANRPKLVLADEPTGALDATNAQQVLDLIRKLCVEVGASLLIVSHDPAITSQLPKAVKLSELNRAAKA